MKREYTDYIVLCPSDTAPSEDIGLKELDSRDRERGWFKCIYHFVIRRDGSIEHGHRKMSEHARGLGINNPTALSICIVGGQGEPGITTPQIESLRDLVRELRDEYPTAYVTDFCGLNPKASVSQFAQYVPEITQ